MYVICSKIDNAFDLSKSLDKSWHDFAQKYNEKRRKIFLAGRALLQLALQSFYNIEKLPLISIDEYGKPFFMESRYPDFNITHSGDVICLAVGEDSQGIDIEQIKERRQLEGLCKRVLCENELQALDREDNKITLFTALWTLRECLIKVSGRGLVDVSSIDVNFDLKKIKYYSISKDYQVKTIRLDKFFNCDLKACLSYAIKKDKNAFFYQLDNKKLVEVQALIYDYEYSLS
ncbi:MAG: 4'-phosphopantetheinyl transferase superfamily protein [Aeromonadales bacterium]|nr:4'-phosphopantetheinyl transferase superfamily protein [Aeromonadales bacterium]